MTRENLIQKYLAAKEVPDTSLVHLGKTPAEAVGSLMDAAVLEFSRDMPQKKVASGTWSGTEITLSGWFSGGGVLSVESPTGNRPKTYLSVDEYEGDPDTGSIYLLTAATGATYRIRYAALHELPDPDESGDDDDATAAVTIADEHHQPFFRLVTAYAFDRLASKHGETQATSFAGDSVSHQTKSGEYTRLAKEARIQYRRMLGLPDTPTVAPVMIHQEFTHPEHRIFHEDAPWPTL